MKFVIANNEPLIRLLLADHPELTRQIDTFKDFLGAPDLDVEVRDDNTMWCGEWKAASEAEDPERFHKLLDMLRPYYVKDVPEFSMANLITKQYNNGKPGFGCVIGEELDEAEKFMKEAGIEYEAEADNPAEVWVKFVRKEQTE